MINRETYCLFISSLRGGGAQRICVTLANGLVKKNYGVKLILLEHTGIYIGEILNEVEIINLKKKHARSSFLPIIKMLIREKPDSILVFNHQLAVQLIIARFILRKKFRIVNRHISNLVEAKANEVINQMKKDIEEITKQIGTVEKPLKVFVYDSGVDKPFTAANNYLTHLIKIAGAKNIFDDIHSIFFSKIRGECFFNPCFYFY